MEIFQPGYYASFRCIAADCLDSCCKEWDVQVDAASAARYRALPGELGEDLRKVLTDIDGETIMLQRDNRCPMWRSDGLCRIQCALGEAALCKTCRDFPRLTHDYGDFMELGLELSCPEAARLIFAARQHSYLSRTVPGGTEPEYDSGAMDILLRSRKTLLSFIDGAAMPINESLAVMLLYGYSVQNELDGGNIARLAPENTLAEAKTYAGTGSMADILAFYTGLEILTPAWRARLAAAADGGWPESLRALARYGIERYYLQAVSDFDLIGRVKLVILSCLVVKALGGDTVQTAQLYSKEIENDAENIDAILDGAYTSPALTDTNILSLLLG